MKRLQRTILYFTITLIGHATSGEKPHAPVIKAGSADATIEDGDYLRVNRHLEPKARPDIRSRMITIATSQA